MARRGRWAWREEEMRGVLANWERSGLRLSRFATREGIAQKTLYRWRRKLGVGDDLVRRGRPPVRAKDRGESIARSMFTEVKPPVRHASSTAIMFEVVLGDSMKVRVPEHFDPDSLRILVETLRGC